MKKILSLIFTPCLLLITACSTHYSVSSGGYYRGHNRVSVGVSGHNSGNVLGALIVGGVIGHLLTESANEAETEEILVETESLDDELVNGYSLDESTVIHDQQRKWYQLGKDGRCYLMENVEGVSEVVSVVPDYSCN